jgi:hypothetical protein
MHTGGVAFGAFMVERLWLIHQGGSGPGLGRNRARSIDLIATTDNTGLPWIGTVIVTVAVRFLISTPTWESLSV